MESGDLERATNAEASVVRVKATLAQALNRGVNLVAKYDEATDELHVSPRHVILPYEIGVREGSEHGPYVGETTVDGQVKAINEICGKNVVELAALLREGTADGTLAHSLRALREDLYQSPLSRIIGTHQDGTPLQTSTLGGVPDIRNALRKGIPPSISEATIIGIARWLARTTDEIVTEEAKKMDDLTTGKPRLEQELNDITKNGIPQTEQSITALREKKQQADQALTGAQEKAQPWTETQQAIYQFIRQRFGHCSKEELQSFLSTMPTNTQFLKERGFLLGKTVEVAADGFAGFDAALKELVNQPEETKKALERFDRENLIDTIILSVRDRLAYLVEESSKDSDGLNELFRDANLLLGQDPTDQQWTLFSKLAGSGKTQDEAKRFLTELLARAVTFSLLTNGLRVPEIKKQLPYALNKIMPERDFFQLLDKTLTTKEFAPIKAELDETEVAKRQVDLQLKPDEESLEKLKTTQQSLHEKLTELARTSSQRLRDQRRQILEKLLVTAVGKREPNLVHLSENVTPFDVYFKSKLLEDVATAVFLGLPPFIANDQRHPSATRSAYSHLRDVMRFAKITGQFSEQSLANLRDFLPEIVSALIPPDHPTPELAIQLVCDLLRNFTPDTTILRYAGIEPQGETREAAQTWQRQAAKVAGEILQGGRVTLIPEDIPRIPLEKLRTLNLAGQKNEAQALVQKIWDPFLAYLRGLGYENGFELVCGAAVQSPELLKNYNRGYFSVDEQQVEQEKSDALINLLFFQQLAQAGHYVIERKTPRPRY